MPRSRVEHRGPEAGYSLPARYFYDEKVFQQEKSKIFFKSWHLVAHVNELREPGSFVTHDIFEQSVIVVPGRDGVIRAFHNVCQHRGNRLVGGAPRKVSDADLRLPRLDLRARRVSARRPEHSGRPGLPQERSWTQAGSASRSSRPSYSSIWTATRSRSPRWRRSAEAEIRRFIPDLDRLTLIEEVDVPVAANWKVIQENSIEGYHFDNSGSRAQAAGAAHRFRGLRA